MILKLKSDADHGDWKTASVFPERWPTIKAGTEVELDKVWWNYYGMQVRVKGPNGNFYDIEPKYFEGTIDLEKELSRGAWK